MRHTSWKALALVSLVALLFAAGYAVGTLLQRRVATRTASEPGPLGFENVAAAAGIRFRHFNAPRASLLPEDVGSGVAWGDYDNDGDEDLYFANFAGPILVNRPDLELTRVGGVLYRNDGDGRFTNVTVSAGVAHVAWDMGALFVDYDNDGWLDLFIYGWERLTLFRNNGDGTFRDATGETLRAFRGFAAGATWGDYDVDGDLDLYVPCYVSFPLDKARKRPLVAGRPDVMTTPAFYPPQRNYLYRNNGDRSFTDVTAEAGVLDAEGRGLQAVFLDVDGDHYPDLYIANDQSPDALFHNNADDTFTNVAFPAGTFDQRAGMGIAVGDINADGLLDFFLTHWVGEDDAFYLNQSEPGRPLFRDIARRLGLTRRDHSMVGWGTGLYDFDLDGRLDLFAAYGSTLEDELTYEVLQEPKLVPNPLLIYWNDGTQFADVTGAAGPDVQHTWVSRGAAFADYDADGRVDIAVSIHNDRPLLLHNTSPVTGRHWVKIALVGRRQNSCGVGATVTVHAAGQRFTRQVLSGVSYLGGDSLILHFGLGEQQRVDRVEVAWPGGKQETFEGFDADHTWVLVEDDPTPRALAPGQGALTYRVQVQADAVGR